MIKKILLLIFFSLSLHSFSSENAQISSLSSEGLTYFQRHRVNQTTKYLLRKIIKLIKGSLDKSEPEKKTLLKKFKSDNLTDITTKSLFDTLMIKWSRSWLFREHSNVKSYRENGWRTRGPRPEQEVSRSLIDHNAQKEKKREELLRKYAPKNLRKKTTPQAETSSAEIGEGQKIKNKSTHFNSSGSWAERREGLMQHSAKVIKEIIKNRLNPDES